MDPNSSAFRRTQSLRYPRGVASTSGTNGFCRKGSRQGVRSRSSKTRHSNSDSSALSRLSISQRTALISSWRSLKSQIAMLMRKILQELEIVSPKVKDIFYKAALVDCLVHREFSTNATMDEHVKYMTRFFDDLIMNIDCETETMAMIKKIGQHHAILNQSCGFEANVWEQLGEITMEKICCTDAVQKTRDAGRAWRTLIAFITDKLRCGFDNETKVYSRRSSADHIPEQNDEQNDELTQKLQQLRMDYNGTVPIEY